MIPVQARCSDLVHQVDRHVVTNDAAEQVDQLRGDPDHAFRDLASAVPPGRRRDKSRFSSNTRQATQARVLGPRDTERTIQERLVPARANPSPEPCAETTPETVGSRGDVIGCSRIANDRVPKPASSVRRGFGRAFAQDRGALGARACASSTLAHAWPRSNCVRAIAMQTVPSLGQGIVLAVDSGANCHSMNSRIVRSLPAFAQSVARTAQSQSKD
jgi:hypothetical protein